MDGGTDLFIMTEDGATGLEESRFGIVGYTPAGERIIGLDSGVAIHGAITISLIKIFIQIGDTGTIQDIGINRSIDNLHIPVMERFTRRVIRVRAL